MWLSLLVLTLGAHAHRPPSAGAPAFPGLTGITFGMSRADVERLSAGRADEHGAPTLGCTLAGVAGRCHMVVGAHGLSSVRAELDLGGDRREAESRFNAIARQLGGLSPSPVVKGQSAFQKVDAEAARSMVGTGRCSLQGPPAKRARSMISGALAVHDGHWSLDLVSRLAGGR